MTPELLCLYIGSRPINIDAWQEGLTRRNIECWKANCYLLGLLPIYRCQHRIPHTCPGDSHPFSSRLFRVSQDRGPTPLTMLVPPILVTLAVFASATSAVVTPRSPTGQCETKLQRKAWHTLSAAEKRAYIDAELCLIKLPATLGLTGAKNRFEELQSAHQVQAAITHGVGAFLPFHRLHMYAHEQLLRSECGYKGAQP